MEGNLSPGFSDPSSTSRVTPSTICLYFGRKEAVSRIICAFIKNGLLLFDNLKLKELFLCLEYSRVEMVKVVLFRDSLKDFNGKVKICGDRNGFLGLLPTEGMAGTGQCGSHRVLQQNYLQGKSPGRKI